MRYIDGDILTLNKGIICQQVNCMLVMGAGLAKSIRRRWEKVYTEYTGLNKTKPEDRLGKCQIVQVEQDLYVANLFGQYNYSYKTRCTDYKALRQALSSLSVWHTTYTNDLPIWVPYKLGCGLAGGSWKIVEEILLETIPECCVIKLKS